MEDEIESGFKGLLSCDTLYYYYYSCPGAAIDSHCSHDHKIVWCGPIGLINYIRKVQSKRFNAPVLGVTSIRNKGGLLRYLEENDSALMVKKGDQIYDYWIGDVSRDHHMICCDELFGHLWDRIRDHVSMVK